MSRSWINFWLDATLLLTFSTLVTVSVIMRFVFPPAFYAHGAKLWGLSYQDWQNLQFGVVATMALEVLVHVMLHWSWVCGLIATRWKRDKKAKIDDGLQTIYGFGFLIVLLTVLGAVIAAA